MVEQVFEVISWLLRFFVNGGDVEEVYVVLFIELVVWGIMD